MTSNGDDSFELYDLKVEVTAPAGASIYCGAKPGDYFELKGEMLHLPPGQGFSIYSLAAVLPLLPAKQRVSDANDWMSTDAEVACPDPNCPTRLRISGPASAASAMPTRRPCRCRRREHDGQGGTVRAAARLRNLAGDPRRLATRRRPWGCRSRGGGG